MTQQFAAIELFLGKKGNNPGKQPLLGREAVYLAVRLREMPVYGGMDGYIVLSKQYVFAAIQSVFEAVCGVVTRVQCNPAQGRRVFVFRFEKNSATNGSCAVEGVYLPWMWGPANGSAQDMALRLRFSCGIRFAVFVNFCEIFCFFLLFCAVLIFDC